jgi:predicted aminopeptidase
MRQHDSLWFIYGSSMVHLWFIYGSSMVHLWFISGSSMVRSSKKTLVWRRVSASKGDDQLSYERLCWPFSVSGPLKPMKKVNVYPAICRLPVGSRCPLVLMRCLLILVLAVSVSGCSTLGYYQQAIVGQWQLLAKRRPLAEVMADPQVSPDVKSRLVVAEQLRVFAADTLHLPVADSYSTYVDVDAPYVVWNVFAAPEFSLTMNTFCYPIAGCVSYKGFFSMAPAAALAQKLAADGNDTFYGGVAAYSTLGWFADPLLSTFITRDDTALAALLFHELAHKVVYIPGDTRFNESFATAVERFGLRQWLPMQSEGEEQAYSDYLLMSQRRGEVIELIMATRAALALVYAQDLNETDKRERKQDLIERLRLNYQVLASQWETPGPFRSWMAADINNARLGAVADYNSLVPAFEHWLASLDGDLSAFFTGVERLSEADKVTRDEYLGTFMAAPLAAVDKPLMALPTLK